MVTLPATSRGVCVSAFANCGIEQTQFLSSSLLSLTKPLSLIPLLQDLSNFDEKG
jgi:hypothetical protein